MAGGHESSSEALAHGPGLVKQGSIHVLFRGRKHGANHVAVLAYLLQLAETCTARSKAFSTGGWAAVLALQAAAEGAALLLVQHALWNLSTSASSASEQASKPGGNIIRVVQQASRHYSSRRLST